MNYEALQCKLELPVELLDGSLVVIEILIVVKTILVQHKLRDYNTRY